MLSWSIEDGVGLVWTRDWIEVWYVWKGRSAQRGIFYIFGLESRGQFGLTRMSR